MHRSKILYPTDLGRRSFSALEKAVQIAHQFNSSITMLNLHDEFMNEKERQMLRVSVDKMKEKFKQTAIRSKEKMQQSIKDLHADDIAIEYVLKEGKPKSDIVRYAKEHDMDLIVISTDGRDNLLDIISGTVSEQVINHAHCPTLVVPGKK